MSHPGYDLGSIIAHILGARGKCKFEDLGEVVVGFCEVYPLSEEEIECLFYCIGYRTFFLYKFCKWQSLMEYIILENGPKYTTLVIKEALEKSKNQK